MKRLIRCIEHSKICFLHLNKPKKSIKSKFKKPHGHFDSIFVKNYTFLSYTAKTPKWRFFHNTRNSSEIMVCILIDSACRKIDGIRKSLVKLKNIETRHVTWFFIGFKWFHRKWKKNWRLAWLPLVYQDIITMLIYS